MTEILDVIWVELEHIFDWILIVCFLFLTTVLNVYALAKLQNVLRAVIHTRCFTDKPKQGGNILPGKEPMVTIQISCFNEGNVIEDTINAACDVDWPKDKLTVQICDDSTDETIDIIDAVCDRWRERGVSCERLTRPNRVGYKAGCLHYHTDRIQGDFVAMFDADHRCENQFLRRCVPHFFDKEGRSKKKVGLVQCPWAYYNTHDNILTEYDALNLDTAFVLEQTGRSAALGIFSFNGTGGIWRKQAIQAGGGWSWETITEDLDLSYESYMAGYKFIYLRDLPQQLELPAGIRAHIQQKYRWTKGFFQVARKTLFRIFRNPRTPTVLKFEVLFQYTGAIAYTITLCVVFLAPILSYRRLFSPTLIGYTVAPATIPLFGGTCTIFGKVSGSNHQYKTFTSRCKRMLFLPTLYIFALGMMIFETHAMYDGLTSDDATFVRTPKEGTPVAGDQKMDYKDDELECRNDEEMPEDMHTSTVPVNASDIESGGGAIPPHEPETSESQVEMPELGWLQRMKVSRCLPKLSKKGQKFKTNFTNGILGLLMGLYLCIWAVVLYVDQKRLDPEERNKVGFGMTFALPLPAVGLFYVHGTFTYQLLAMKLKSMQKKRSARREERQALLKKSTGGGEDVTVNTEAMSMAQTIRSRISLLDMSSSVDTNPKQKENTLRNFFQSLGIGAKPGLDHELVSVSSSIASASTLQSSRRTPRKIPAGRLENVIDTDGRTSVAWSDLSLSITSKADIRFSTWSNGTFAVPVVFEGNEEEEEEKQEDDGMVAGTSYFATSKSSSELNTFVGNTSGLVGSDDASEEGFTNHDAGATQDGVPCTDISSKEGTSASVQPQHPHTSPLTKRTLSRAISSNSSQYQSPPTSPNRAIRDQRNLSFLRHGSLRSLMRSPITPKRKLAALISPRMSIGTSPFGLKRKASNSKENESHPPIPGTISFHDSKGKGISVPDFAPPFEVSPESGSDISFVDASVDASAQTSFSEKDRRELTKEERSRIQSLPFADSSDESNEYSDRFVDIEETIELSSSSEEEVQKREGPGEQDSFKSSWSHGLLTSPSDHESDTPPTALSMTSRTKSESQAASENNTIAHVENVGETNSYCSVHEREWMDSPRSVSLPSSVNSSDWSREDLEDINDEEMSNSLNESFDFSLGDFIYGEGSSAADYNSAMRLVLDCNDMEESVEWMNEQSMHRTAGTVLPPVPFEFEEDNSIPYNGILMEKDEERIVPRGSGCMDGPKDNDIESALRSSLMATMTNPSRDFVTEGRYNNANSKHPNWTIRSNVGTCQDDVSTTNHKLRLSSQVATKNCDGWIRARSQSSRASSTDDSLLSFQTSSSRTRTLTTHPPGTKRMHSQDDPSSQSHVASSNGLVSMLHSNLWVRGVPKFPQPFLSSKISSCTRDQRSSTNHEYGCSDSEGEDTVDV